MQVIGRSSARLIFRRNHEQVARSKTDGDFFGNRFVALPEQDTGSHRNIRKLPAQTFRNDSLTLLRGKRLTVLPLIPISETEHAGVAR